MKNAKTVRWLQILACLLAVLCAFPPVARAEAVASGVCGAEGDNLTWALDADGLLTIGGTGDMADYGWRGAPWYEVHSAVRTVVIRDGVTSVGKNAFSYCENLVSATVPDSVTRMGAGAFSHCRSLSALTLPFVGASPDGTGGRMLGHIFGKGEQNFFPFDTELQEEYGTAEGFYRQELDSYEEDEWVRVVYAEIPKTLKSVTLTDGAKTVPGQAFWQCKSLTSVTIPKGVTYIGWAAFFGCKALKDVWYNGTEADWAAVTVMARNEALTGATMHFNPSPADATPTDATPTDATPTDATPTDATPTDATPTDVTPTDATPTDATPTDATPTDATPTDATPTDATPGQERAPGDVDGNGKITSADARLALRASVGLEKDIKKGSAAWVACDADGDGKVSSGDARLILRASVGLEDPKTFGKKA